MKFAAYKTSRLAFKNAGAAVSKNGGISSGFTLIELLVYMAIMGFIIIVAGRVFSDSTGMRVRSQNMLASAEEGGRVTALLKEDISQMGTKSFGTLSASSYSIETVEKVHIDYKADLSSYTLNAINENYDDITFRKVHYDESGKCLAVMEIRWHVKDKNLSRSCKILSDAKCSGLAPGCDETDVEIARDVNKFKLFPSKPGAAESTVPNLEFPAKTNLGEFSIIPQTTNLAVANQVSETSQKKYKLQGFPKNDPGSSQNTNHFYLAENGQTNGSCKPFTFEKGEIYAIEFHLPCDKSACSNSANGSYDNEMVMFQPGYDHLSVGLRTTDMSGKPIVIDNLPTPDFLFYPPQNNTANSVRHFEFGLPQQATACVGITAAFYSETAHKGFLEIEKFKVYKTENVYHFPSSAYNPSASSKALVKAFQLNLDIEKKGEINKVVTVIPVPNNGLVPAEESK